MSIEKREVYCRFLELCGFDKDEIPETVYLLDKVLKRLFIEPEDVKLAVTKRIPQFFETEVTGVRRLLKAYVKELFDLAMAKDSRDQGTKIVYGILPAITIFYRALKLAFPQKVYVSFPDVFMVQILNTFFHKVTPYLEAAESHGMDQGAMHCALNKIRYGAHLLGVLPPADLSWIWGFICDEAPKCEELIQDFDGTEFYVTRICHDTPLGHHEDEDDNRVSLIADLWRDGFQKTQEILGLEIEDESVKRAIDERQNYLQKVFRLAKLLKADPLPLGGTEMHWFASPLAIPFNTGYDEINRALDETIGEVKSRIAKKEGILPEGAPRILKDTVLPVGTPWVTKMIQDFGVGMPYPEGLTPLPKEIAPSRFVDPYMVSAEAWLRMSNKVNAVYRAELICEKIKFYKLDGVLFSGFVFDRWWGTDAYIIKRFVENHIGVPVLYMEGDIYDDRDYSEEAIRTRLETFAELLKMRKNIGK